VNTPLEPLAAENVGQAAGKERHRQEQKEEVEHVTFLPLNQGFHDKSAIDTIL